MTRINGTGTTGPQPIPSQDSNSQQVSKPGTQTTQQEPSAAEQQQGKQAAQGRKSDIDLQGTIKQSELAQFHGPGGSHGAGVREPKNVSKMDDNQAYQVESAVKSTIAGAVVGGPSGALTGAMVGSVPKSDEQIQAEKIYYEMMRMQQLGRGIPDRRVDKAHDGTEKGLGGMQMSPMEVENAKAAAEAEKAQKVKDAVVPIIAGAITGGPTGALLGSVEAGVPKLHGEQLIQARMMEGSKELIETRDPISGERIIDLEAEKENPNKTEETNVDDSQNKGDIFP